MGTPEKLSGDELLLNVVDLQARLLEELKGLRADFAAQELLFARKLSRLEDVVEEGVGYLDDMR